MRRIGYALSVMLVLSILASVLYAVAGCSKTKSESGKPVSAVCPVMKTEIPDVTKAVGKSVYKGKTYYFCCKSCKPRFDKDPEQYVGREKTISAICPVMGSEIPDITKAAGNTVYTGKTYYFCCAGCKPEFDKNPEKYVGDKKQ